MPNGDEIRLHTDPGADDATHRSRISYRYQVERVGTGIETVTQKCDIDADCPSGTNCQESICRCTGDTDCSSRIQCQTTSECTHPGETCVNGKCEGEWTCRPAPDDLEVTEQVCAAEKHITCYEYTVENIALVTPRADATESVDGWNDIYLYFGEVPFDNPGDYGNFQMACVRAWYNSSDGTKYPADGTMEVPQSAWRNPESFSSTYIATATDAGPDGDNVECGSDPGSGSALYCNHGDACIDAAQSRCRIAPCVCPLGKTDTCY
jgi:hypothetical protein